PRAVRLRSGQRVVKALRADGTAGADRLGLPLTYVTLGLPLPVGAEEEHEVLTPARGIILPTPAGARAGELPTYLRHEKTTFVRGISVIEPHRTLWASLFQRNAGP